MLKYFKTIIAGAPLVYIFLFVFIFPLIFSFVYPSNNVFELLKAAYLWPGVTILLFLSILKLIFTDSRIGKIKNYYLWLALVLLFLLLIFNSFFVAGDQWSAIFGDYNRRQGLITQLAYLLWFLLVIYNLFSSRDFKKKLTYFLGAMALSGFLVAIYGFLQYIGVDLRAWQEPVMANRIISSLGQPNFLASFLLLSLGASLAFLALNKNLYWFLIISIATFFQLLAIFLSASRAAYLALLIVIIISLFVFIKKKKAIVLISLSALLTIFFIFILMPSSFLSNRLMNVFDYSQGSVAARLQFYPATWQAFLNKPLLGYGIEQSGQALVSFYQPDWALFGQVNDYPDRAHNLFLDLALNFGILGLAVYAILLFIIIYLLFFNLKKKDRSNCFLLLVLSLLAYFISLLFGFSSLATAFYAWTILAILLTYYFKEKKEKETEQFKFKDNKQKFLKVILVFILIVNGFLIYGLINNSTKTIRADQLFFACRMSLANNHLSGFNFCWQALDRTEDPVQKSFYQSFIFSYIINNYYSFDQELRDVFKNYLADNYFQLEDSNYNLAFTKAQVACFLNKADWKKQFEELILASPVRPAVYRAKANCYFVLQEWPKAIENYQQALALLPSPDDPRLNIDHQKGLKFYRYLLFFALGQSYFSLKDYHLAIENYQQAYYNYPDDFNLWQRIAQSNYLLNNLEEAINNYLRVWQQDSLNYYWPARVADLYEELGDKQTADFYQQKALELNKD